MIFAHMCPNFILASSTNIVKYPIQYTSLEFLCCADGSWGSAAQYIKIKIQFISSPAQQIINNNDAKYWSSQIVTRMWGEDQRWEVWGWDLFTLWSLPSSMQRHFHILDLSFDFYKYVMQFTYLVGGSISNSNISKLLGGEGKIWEKKSIIQVKYWLAFTLHGTYRLKYAHEQIYRSLTMNIVDPLSNSSGE